MAQSAVSKMAPYITTNSRKSRGDKNKTTCTGCRGKLTAAFSSETNSRNCCKVARTHCRYKRRSTGCCRESNYGSGKRDGISNPCSMRQFVYRCWSQGLDASDVHKETISAVVSSTYRSNTMGRSRCVAWLGQRRSNQSDRSTRDIASWFIG